MNDFSPDTVAAQDLAKACHEVANHTRVERIALLAYIQANMTQAAVQVLVNYMKEKGLFADHDMAKRLAEAYDATAAGLRQRQLLDIPRAPLVRPRNGGG